MQQKSSEHFSGCNREDQQGHRPAGAKMKTTKSSKRWLHRYARSTRKFKQTLSTHEWGRKTASRKHRKGWGPRSLFVVQVFREGHRVPQQLSWVGLADPRGSLPTQDVPGFHEGVIGACLQALRAALPPRLARVGPEIPFVPNCLSIPRVAFNYLFLKSPEEKNLIRVFFKILVPCCENSLIKSNLLIFVLPPALSSGFLPCIGRANHSWRQFSEHL